jgi:hypothetical protein
LMVKDILPEEIPIEKDAITVGEKDSEKSA